MAVSEVMVQPVRLLLSLSVSVSISWTVNRSLAVRVPTSEVFKVLSSLASVIVTFELFDLGSCLISSGNYISFENLNKISAFFETSMSAGSGI